MRVTVRVRVRVRVRVGVRVRVTCVKSIDFLSFSSCSGQYLSWLAIRAVCPTMMSIFSQTSFARPIISVSLESIANFNRS